MPAGAAAPAESWSDDSRPGATCNAAASCTVSPGNFLKTSHVRLGEGDGKHVLCEGVRSVGTNLTATSHDVQMNHSLSSCTFPCHTRVCLRSLWAHCSWFQFRPAEASAEIMGQHVSVVSSCL